LKLWIKHSVIYSHHIHLKTIFPPFGGKTVVLGGDIHQTLPVIEGSSRSQIVNSAIVNSSLWPHVTVLHLKRNMRLSALTLTDESRMELVRFSQWMLDIGEGNVESRAKEGESEASWIEIPDEFLLKPTGDKVLCIISTVYPELTSKYMDLEYLKERAILTPTNDVADMINSHVVSLIPEDERQYLSCDTVVKAPNT
jgi:ATP-dependent DNA helicase PIF1